MSAKSNTLKVAFSGNFSPQTNAFPCSARNIAYDESNKSTPRRVKATTSVGENAPLTKRK